ncbi:hypothetical protein HQ590_16120 [bacterium]|nr:hypothetical protein [bacterium]
MKRLLISAVALVAAAAVAMAGEVKTGEMELQGAIGCSHCSYHKGDGCAVGLKTTDGKIYILEKASAELMEVRMKGGELKVKGTVTEKDGVFYVDATSAELVK